MEFLSNATEMTTSLLDACTPEIVSSTFGKVSSRLRRKGGLTNEARWQAAQAKELGFWERTGVVESEMHRVLERYAAEITDVSRELNEHSHVLDLGCGPTCAARLVPIGTKTYLDPLLNSYAESQRMYGLPAGEFICAMAENIPKADKSFDLVLSVNALDHFSEPERAIAEVQRVLKDQGLFLLGLFLHPPIVAALRTFIERSVPFFRDEAHPHSFTITSIKGLLSRHFRIERETRVFRKDAAWFPSLHREDWLFLCRKTNFSWENR